MEALDSKSSRYKTLEYIDKSFQDIQSLTSKKASIQTSENAAVGQHKFK